MDPPTQRPSWFVPDRARQTADFKEDSHCRNIVLGLRENEEDRVREKERERAVSSLHSFPFRVRDLLED